MNRSRILNYSILLVSFLFIYVSGANAQSPPARYDFNITLSDGVQLDCSKFVPGGNAPAVGYPCIIFCHGYGRSKEDDLSEAEDQASYGIYTMTYSMRGQGNSGGYSNLISTTEMNDLLQVIDYVKKDANTNDDRIAMTGGSQGGIIPFMASCYGAKVRCLVTELASPEFASNWIGNGCVKMTFLWTLSYDNSIVRYNDEVKQYRDWAVSNSKEDWQKLVTAVPMNRDFIDRVKDSQVPMLISNTWQDKFFNTLGMIKIKDQLKVPYVMYFGAVSGHGGDVTPLEKQYHEHLVNEWFYYWLRDQQNNILKDKKFVYDATAYDGGSIAFTQYNSPVWPPQGVQDEKFYFTPSVKLSSMPNSDPSQSYATLVNEVHDRSMTLLNAVYYAFTGPFDSKFTRNSVVFESEPLTRERKMVGTPQVKLYYSSDAQMCQYNFQIWEVSQGGQENFITSVNYTDRDNSPGSIREKLIDGDAYSHNFRQGSKIKVVVTNLDIRPNDKFLRTYPYVLPVLENANNKIMMTPEYASYITIPLM